MFLAAAHGEPVCLGKCCFWPGLPFLKHRSARQCLKSRCAGALVRGSDTAAVVPPACGFCRPPCPLLTPICITEPRGSTGSTQPTVTPAGQQAGPPHSDTGRSHQRRIRHSKPGARGLPLGHSFPPPPPPWVCTPEKAALLLREDPRLWLESVGSIQTKATWLSWLYMPNEGLCGKLQIRSVCTV